jgi:hypothetical protein
VTTVVTPVVRSTSNPSGGRQAKLKYILISEQIKKEKGLHSDRAGGGGVHHLDPDLQKLMTSRVRLRFPLLPR